MIAEIPQTLKYRGSQLDAAPLLKVENFINWEKSLGNANHVRDSELVSLFGKLKYEENLIDSIYDTKNKKSLTTATPLSTAFFSTSIIQDIQDNPDDEEDTRSNKEEVSSDDNKIVEVKVLMALIDDESGAVGKGSATNRE
ncbi:hypothetical protein Tco_1336508 [Tanacetum coccineum]